MKYFIKIVSRTLVIISIMIASPAFSGETEENLNLESEWYAQTFNISEEEARERQSIMNEAGEIASIFALEEDSFTGMYITHEPKFRVIYTQKRGVKNNLNKRLRKILHKVSWKKYAKVRQVKYSALELKTKLSQATDLATEYAEGGYTTSIDIQNNKITLGVLDKYAFSDVLQTNGLSVPKGVVLEEITELPNTTIDAGDMTNLPSGAPHCTVGFIVRNTANVLGVASAHHCGGAQLWNGTALGQFRSISSRDTGEFWGHST